MSVLTKLRQRVKKYMSEADQRAERRMAKAKTQAERDRVRSILRTDKMAIRQQESEARAALLKAQTAEKKAKKELKELGGSFSMNSLRGFLGVPTPKRTTRRRTTKRRVTRRKR